MSCSRRRCPFSLPKRTRHRRTSSSRRLGFILQIPYQMDSEANHQHKQERSRTRWTSSLDKIFADLVVCQIQLGNRPNNVFDKKTWNHIRDEFNKQTDLNFNNNQLRKHLDVLRTRFYNLKSAYDQNDFTLDNSYDIGFDLWEELGAQPRSEMIKVKDCPIYEQLCTIFTESAADGKYAQSSHYEQLDKSAINLCPDGGTPCSETPSTKTIQGNLLSSENMMKAMVERKRKRLDTNSSLGQSSKGPEIYLNMAEALLEMLAASKARTQERMPSEDRFSITKCIVALDEIEGIDNQLYFAALDLFENRDLRETFISLKGVHIRGRWLEEKCGNLTSS